GTKLGDCMAQVGGVMRATLVILGLVLAVAGAAAAPRESTILSGGRILASIEDSAGTATARWTDAVLVLDGRIAAVGSLAEVDREARRLGAHPRRVSLAGRFAMAGLCDAHGHVAGLGTALERLRFQNTTSAEQIAAMVGAKAKQRPKGA